MKTKLISLAVASIFSLSAGVAAAEDDAFQGSWYLMPGIGLLNTDSDLKADRTAPSAFLRLGKELSQHWDVQLGASYGKADSNSDANGTALDGSYKQTLVGVDALYMFSRDKLRPFLLAGLGYAHNKIDYTYNAADASDSKNSWMANVGAGVQYFFTDNIGLQADVRHVWSRAKANFPAGTTVGGFTGNSTETIGNNYLNLGVIFNFGAPKKLAAAEPAPTLPEVAPTEPEAVPPMKAEPEPVYGPEKPAFEKITLQAEVLFDFDKSVVKDNGKKILDTEVVEKMKAHPEVEMVLITGHTDRIGTDQYNQKLSERRANAVKAYLESQGIEANRLHAVGKGEKDPVEACKGVRGKKLIECLQPNRRVVVEIEAQRIQE